MEFWAIRYFLLEKYGPEFAPRYATRVWSLFIEPLSLLFKRIAAFFKLTQRPPSRIRICSDELNRGRSIILNFETRDRRRAFDVPLGETELSYLQTQHPELLIVPTVFVWQRKRVIEKEMPKNISSALWRTLWLPLISAWNLFLGDPYSPNFNRQTALLMLGYTHSTLRATQVLVFNSDIPAKSLRRQVLMEIQQEKRVILGPTFRSTRFIGEGIFRELGFRRFAQVLAAEEGVTEMALLKRADKYFREMAAKYSYSTIEISSWFLDKIFNTIFSGVSLDDADFEKVRKASKEGPLVFIPSHKSYVDFLILSYILHDKEISPPHVIAGINLNFWPMGSLFKRGGAIFIRRSFRGNILYTELLKRYVCTLLSNKINLEFFIEGQRSRTGKLAPPRFGILKMIVDAYLRGDLNERVRFVPVSLMYDRVTEDKLHKRELEGGEKVQESFLGVLKALKVLFRNYGKVHMRVGDPIAIEDWAQRQIGEAGQSTELVKLSIQKLAFEVCHRINGATPVTSIGIICALLLARSEASMSKHEFEACLRKINADLLRLGTPMTHDLRGNFLGSCRRAAEILIRDKIIETFDTGIGGIGYRIPFRQRIAALYYKNSAIHALLELGIAGLTRDARDMHNRNQELLELRSLLQFEFFFSDKELFVSKILALPEDIDTRLYSYMIDSYLENVQIGLRALFEMQHLIMEEKEWKTRLMKRGRGLAAEGLVQRPEAVNTQAFQSFIQMARNRQWLKPTRAEEDLLKPAEGAELLAEIDSVQTYRDRLKNWNPGLSEAALIAHESVSGEEAPHGA